LNPLAPKKNKGVESKTWSNIFAFGDVCLTKLNESKEVVSILQLSKTIAQNIVQILVGSDQLVPIPD
jgi:hypothetical protein